MDIKRVIVIVLDGVGAGELPDADKFDDKGTNTLKHTAEAVGGLELPNMGKLGIGNITEIKGTPPVDTPLGAYGKSKEKSAGKDTLTGHWEMMGLTVNKPFPTYPDGFPQEIIDKFIELTGVKGILGNIKASGTEIIKELGEEHLKTGYPIVYTSADSVFQIAAHEKVIPLERLYEICQIARDKVLVGEHAVGRVIARPFIGKDRNTFKRTPNRKDFPVEPFGDTLLDTLTRNGITVYAVGKIHDIFAGRGMTDWVHTDNNTEGMEKTLEALEKVDRGLIFTNLVDYDMLYGHRRNPKGMAEALKEFDDWLPSFMSAMDDTDILVITADHGNDPTHTKHTDHTREHIPILVWGPKVKKGVNLGVRETYADIGKTISEIFNVFLGEGTSFLKEII